jgi:hypothetical protein
VPGSAEERVMGDVYDEIRAEREAQDAEWGGPDHDDHHTPIEWVGFIVRHTVKAVGGAVQFLDESHMWTAHLVVSVSTTPLFRRQMVRVAALAVAAIESSDRHKAGKGETS